jgi:hypothetical protein
VHGDTHPDTHADADSDNHSHRACVADAQPESLHLKQFPYAHAESLRVPDNPAPVAYPLHPAELPHAHPESILDSELLRDPKSGCHPEFFQQRDGRGPDSLGIIAVPRWPTRWAGADDLPGSHHSADVHAVRHRRR